MIEKNGKSWHLYIIIYYKAFGKLSGITTVTVAVLIGGGRSNRGANSSYRILREIL